MIELRNNHLVFSFTEVHPKAVGRIHFQRTLRIPDNGEDYPLPAGFGAFHLEHIEDHKASVPHAWMRRGGVMLPLYQSEAMWIDFSGDYPMAVKIATGKIDVITGKSWKNELSESPQDYAVLSEQPWIDGYCVEKDIVRQFVAMPLGQGVTAEEQITGKAEFGGIQVIAYPMKADVYKEHFEKKEDELEYLEMPSLLRRQPDYCAAESLDMGIAPGGRIKQELYADTYGIDAWDTANTSRCFIHIVNSEQWAQVTGLSMPTQPISQRDYSDQGIPWFDYYADGSTPLKGSGVLRKLKGLGSFNKDFASDNITVKKHVVVLQPEGTVSDGEF
ncbi:MAG: hypothetical protein V7739_22095 [Motiliproteus sp.]